METLPETLPAETLPAILANHYKAFPDQISLRLLFAQGEEAEISYRLLLEGAAGYAQEYSRQGIRPGEVVVLVLQHGLDLVYSFWGAILAGVVPAIMPFLTEKLSPERYAQDMTALLQTTQPAGIVTYPDFLASVLSTLQPGSSVRAVISSGQVLPVSDPQLESLPGTAASPEDIILLQHSSGTTGLQKGVALSHRAVLNQLRSYSQAIHLTGQDVIVSWLPLYHDMGLIAGFVMPVLFGVPLVLLSPFDWVRAPQRLLQAITRYQGSLCWLPNFAYNFCAAKIRERDLEGVDLSSLRAVINCSEPMQWESHQVFLDRFLPYGLKPQALAACYAMAENVFAVTQGGIDIPVQVDSIDALAFTTRRQAEPSSDPETALRMLSAGRPISNTRVKIVNDHHHPLPDRQIGEIALQSSSMLTGYYQRPDLTAKAFHAGWYLTGDLGYSVEGELYVVGRKKDLIIVGGKNIYPQDLELLANKTPGVHPGRVVAFGVYNHASGTEDVVLVAELAVGLDAADPAVRQKISAEIRQNVMHGSAVALRQVHLVAPKWIIKTSSGKISRSANREKFLRETAPAD